MMRSFALTVAVAFFAGCIPDAQPPTPPAVSAPLGAPPLPGGALMSPAPIPAVALRRGMNAGDALEAPTEGAWGVVLEPSFFDAVKAAGFDHVRIPVRFSGHAAASAPYTIDETFFRRVDWAIDQVVSRGMSAVVDLHHYEELMEAPDAHAARFVGLWTQIAARYASRPPSVMYELLNEPSHNLTPERWNALLTQALRALRAVDPARTVIVDSTSWAAARDLASLWVPVGDPHLVASFHMYQPILFTHQGMPWMPPEFGTTGVVFPGPPRSPVEPSPAAQRVGWVAEWFQRYNALPPDRNPGGFGAITEQFELVRAFAERARVPIYMGEFGAADKGDMASRVIWTRAVRKEAERRGIAWAYWDDGGSFKVYDQRTRTWVTELRAALLD